MSSRTRKLFVITLTLSLMVGILALIGCAPKIAESPSGGSAGGASATGDDTDDAQLNTPFAWSMSSDCSICHTTEASGTDETTHPQAAAHAAENIACVDCHTKQDVLTQAHAGVTLADKPATKVTTLTVDAQTCIDCHGTLEEVAALTVESQALKDDQGLVVNPHQRPAGERHIEVPSICTDCHNNHSETLARDAKKY
ncbi:MAG: cytochrome c3 family protein, partial [Coriobacteriales bacterium]|nr:cytochrome c3 family protein [Coriobacteriales bacterium]